MRQTSVDVYYEILASGLLGDMQKDVVRILYKEAPLTGREINERGNGVSLHKRLSELERRGVVEAVGEKLCSITGYMVMAWALTGELPKECGTAAPKTLYPRPDNQSITRAGDRIRQFAFMTVDADVVRLLAWLGSRYPA